ncbi:OmpP1/FadL family transporter [Anditalea andensis]|uniref:Long-chain fatty acid transporter n=1 Tax=Anditalea andensis TaxID=1048983 RepID=A0A074L2X4_9BACT|nr:hypothetical protein [Anditalea andensis]KEO74850.1 hypothetical protein EL17_04005 [Anditalea andensis]
MKSINKWILGISAFSLFGAGEVMGQSGYYQDALRFSQLRSTGSARVSALGGTQNSLGGDVSNIHHNPAGLGFFRRSEFSLTPGYSSWGTESVLGNVQGFDRIPTSNFALPNLSLVISSPRDPLTPGRFRGGSFGISVNRLANFNSEFAIAGITPTSIANIFADDAFGIPGNSLDVENSLRGLAYSTNIIVPTQTQGSYVPFNETEAPDIYDQVITQGGINQVTFAYGANLDNKLFLGASLGVSSINFSQFKTYTEDYLTGDLIGFDINEDLYINGTGVNLNIGAIYKPIDQINLGLSFQTPTWYRLNEESDSEIISEFENPNETFSARTDLFTSTYNINTPMKVNAGATYFIGKNGFISADIDYVDYTAARVNSRDFGTAEDNNAINQLYTATFNYRVGGEFRYDIFRFRAGYGYYGNPFRNDFDNPSRHTQQVSGGVGVRLANFYIDAAYMNTSFNQFYNSYSGSPDVDIRNTINSGMLTVGFNF